LTNKNEEDDPLDAGIVGDRGISEPLIDPKGRRGWIVSFTSQSLYSRQRDPLPNRSAEPLAQFGWVWKNWPTQVFDPWTVQTVTRNSTDYAIPPLYTQREQNI
jgi:hypothetical protein